MVLGPRWALDVSSGTHGSFLSCSELAVVWLVFTCSSLLMPPTNFHTLYLDTDFFFLHSFSLYVGIGPITTTPGSLCTRAFWPGSLRLSQCHSLPCHTPASTHTSAEFTRGTTSNAICVYAYVSHAYVDLHVCIYTHLHKHLQRERDTQASEQ